MSACKPCSSDMSKNKAPLAPGSVKSELASILAGTQTDENMAMKIPYFHGGL
jgi:hypothetical protein